jgi:hypothetical protein
VIYAQPFPPRRALALLVLTLGCFGPAACASDGAPSGAVPASTHEAEGENDGNGEVGSVAQALANGDPVSAAVTQSCTTSVVKGLSTQLVGEIQCLRPNTLKSIDKLPGIALGSAVFPYLQSPAVTAMVAAQKARGTTLSINSALRTLPQQYMLYRWYQTGRCGISLAAKPGTSNHESALALDVQDNAGWRSAMTGKSFRWLGASDPVHYDYVGAGAVDLRGLSVKAFQRLWNRNNPTDKITEDGSYGPATESRLAKAPIGGFAKGADCTNVDGGAKTDGGGSIGEDGGTEELPPYTPDAVPDAPEPADGAEIAPLDAGSGCSTGSAPASRGALAGLAGLAGLALVVALGRRKRR